MSVFIMRGFVEIARINYPKRDFLFYFFSRIVESRNDVNIPARTSLLVTQ